MFNTLLHLVTPRYSNNQKAKLLHSSSFIAICLLMIAYQFLVSFAPRIRPSVLGYASNISVDQVISLTNQKRVDAGLSPLQTSSVLSQAAQAKGTYMVEHNFWAHVAPDGTQPWKFFKDFGYKYSYAGENLAKNFSDASSAVDGWMSSPTHKENMLSPKYREIGIAVIEGPIDGVDTTIIVQFFGTRAGDQLPTLPVAAVQAAKTATPLPIKTASPAALLTLASPISSPTIAPTPTVTVTPTEATNVVGLSRTPTPQNILVSPFTTTKGISVAIVGILLLVLVIDGFVVSRRRIARIGGRSFAHLAFLGMILAVALILKAGKVI